MPTLVDVTYVNKNLPTIDAPWLNMVNRFVNDTQAPAGAGSSLIPFKRADLPTAIATTLYRIVSRLPVNVMTDCGAVGDGVTDDTAAFNLATQATAAWSTALEYDIIVPAGPGIKYKLNSSVYVRKGQTLHGDGHAAQIDATANTTTSVFVMGSGLIAGVQTPDTGGAPVKIENIFGLGGAANHGFIYTDAQGFEMNSIFLSAVGVGYEFGPGAADGLCNNLEADQALLAFYFRGAQNVTVSTFNIFLPSFAVQYDSNCADITFSNGVIEYPQFAGIQFAVGQSLIKGIAFSNVAFTMNVQYGTFNGFIVSSASSVEAQFTGCSFRNMFNYAINHNAGVSPFLTFTGCIFDGLKTISGYNQSTTAKCLNTGPAGGAGTYNFFGCEFRNLLGEIARIDDGVTKLNFVGGYVVGCDANAVSQKRFNVVTVSPMDITVKGVVGFPYVFTSGSNQCANLPWWGASTVWKVAIKGNKQAVGDAYYSAAEESIMSVTWQNNAGTKSIFADRINLWQTANRTNPGQLSSALCLGTAPGGAASTTTFAATGSINVSVPFTNASAFDFFAETVV